MDVDVGDDGTAIIPDELLQDYHTLTAYAYATDDAGGYTKVQQDFAVYKRPKPSDYVYTPTEHAGFDRLRAEIGELSALQTNAKNNLVAAINEAAASGGGGADWSQNDPDGDGYVANRPGGYDVIETRKIFEMKLVSINDENMLTADADGSFAEGTPVHVSIDGAPEVICTIAVTVSGEIPVYSFGSKSYDEVVAGGLGATDYIVVWYEGGGKRAYQGIAGSDLVGKTIVARADVATPVKIPDKYLDLDSAKEIMQFTISYNRSSKEYESDRTYDELVAALNAGKTVFAKFGNTGMGESYTYGWLYKRYMYVPGICVYVGGDIPYQWECMKGNKWTKRKLLRLDTGHTTPKKAGTAAYGTSSWASRDDHVHPSELPDVSADDDGKLLGVTGGAWGKVDKPSNGGLSLGLTSAAVGQIAKITAVDASGVPTAWAPVDMPSGMSEWQLITDTTIAEEDASVTLFVSQKDSGESFLCHELLIAWIGIAVTDGTESGKAWISLNPDEAGYNSGECGLMTSAYFYYTSHANYMRTMHVESLPYKVEYVDTSVSTNDSIDAQVIWQNGISSVEVSAYGRKSFYGRVIIYGR